MYSAVSSRKTNMKEELKEKVCHACNQTKNYFIGLDRGTVIILKALSKRIELKGVNAVHLNKEMEVPKKMWRYEWAVTDGVLTSRQIGNITRARVHGLVAKVKESSGSWCITDKGFDFLRGMPIDKYKEIDKATKRSETYMPGKFLVTAQSLMKKEDFWESINYHIKNGHVVKDIVIEDGKQVPLFS